MSKIVCHAGILYLCGQTANDAGFTYVSGQTREVLKRIDTLLTQAGTGARKTSLRNGLP